MSSRATVRRIGIEVSSGSVRVAEVAHGRGGKYRLVRYAEVHLPHGAVIDGTVVDRAAVSSAVANCMSKGGFKASHTTGVLHARLSVAGLRAIIREIDMPSVPESELDAAVHLQAADLLPFPMDRTLLSARATGPSRRSAAAPADGGAPQQRVLVASAHRDLVEPVVDVVTAAGIVVDGVDLAATALLRSLVDPSGTEDGPEAIVNVGAELTTVIVHEHGDPLFVRTIAGGGNTMTRAIASALDLPVVDAESVKRRLGASAGIAARVPPEAIAAARDGSASLLADIRSSIDYFASLDGGTEARRIVLTGGGAQLSGFLERLQHQTRATVVAGNCLARVDASGIDSERPWLASTGSVVLGLALEEPAGRKVLDLIPPETLRLRHQRRIERSVGLAASVAVLALVAGAGLRYLQVYNAEHDVGSLKGSIALLQSEIPRYDAVAKADAAISSDQGLGQPLVSQEVNWPAVLQDLARYTPYGVGASGFSGTVAVPAAATTTGTALASAAPSPALPSPTATIGNVSLSFSGQGYPSFQQWFDAMLGSKRFEIEQYSGVTSGGASSGISFSAQLGVTGLIHTARLGEFEVGAR